jgi:hypothetical protein
MCGEASATKRVRHVLRLGKGEQGLLRQGRLLSSNEKREGAACRGNGRAGRQAGAEEMGEQDGSP